MKRIRLGDYCNITAGGDKPTFFSDIQTAECRIPVFANGLNNEGLVGYTNKAVITEKAVTMSARGSTGIPVYRNTPYVPIIRLISIVPNSDIDCRYLFYLLKTRSIIGTGSVQAQLTVPMVSNIELDIVEDITVQKKIGAILGNLDEKIINNNNFIQQLTKIAQLIYNYWFLQFDFPDEKGRPYRSSGGKMVWNEKLKREIPEGWKTDIIGNNIIHINTGLNPRNNFKLGSGNIRYITVKNINKDGTIDFSNCDLIDNVAQKLVHHRSDIAVGDILYASISPLGRCYLIQSDPTDWDINESIFSIRTNPQKLNNLYFYNVLASDYFTKLAESNSWGSVFSGIRIKTLENTRILIPPMSIQMKFKKVVQPFFKKNSILCDENQQLVSLRDFLLPLLMNGQVTIQDKEG